MKKPSVLKDAGQQPECAFRRQATAQPHSHRMRSKCRRAASLQCRIQAKPAGPSRLQPGPPQPPARFLPAPASKWSRQRARQLEQRAARRKNRPLPLCLARQGLQAAADGESPDCGPACPSRCKAHRPAQDRRLLLLSAPLHRPAGIQCARCMPARRLRNWASRCALDSQATMRACWIALGQDQRLAARRRAGSRGSLFTDAALPQPQQSPPPIANLHPEYGRGPRETQRSPSHRLRSPCAQPSATRPARVGFRPVASSASDCQRS